MYGGRWLKTNISHVIVFLVAFKFLSAAVTITRVTGVELRGSKPLFIGTTEQNSACYTNKSRHVSSVFFYHVTLSVWLGRDGSILTVGCEIWESGYFSIGNVKGQAFLHPELWRRMYDGGTAPRMLHCEAMRKCSRIDRPGSIRR
jgi:hypothetical protein